MHRELLLLCLRADSRPFRGDDAKSDELPAGVIACDVRLAVVVLKQIGLMAALPARMIVCILKTKAVRKEADRPSGRAERIGFSE